MRGLRSQRVRQSEPNSHTSRSICSGWMSTVSLVGDWCLRCFQFLPCLSLPAPCTDQDLRDLQGQQSSETISNMSPSNTEIGSGNGVTGVKLFDFHHNTLALSITGGVLLMILALLMYFCYRRLTNGVHNFAQRVGRGPPMVGLGQQEMFQQLGLGANRYPMMHSRMSQLLEAQQQEMNLRMMGLEARQSMDNQGAIASPNMMLNQADRFGRVPEGTMCPPSSPVNTRSHRTKRGEKPKHEFTFPEL